jgi:hypothetical protein
MDPLLLVWSNSNLGIFIEFDLIATRFEISKAAEFVIASPFTNPLFFIVEVIPIALIPIDDFFADNS